MLHEAVKYTRGFWENVTWSADKIRQTILCMFTWQSQLLNSYIQMKTPNLNIMARYVIIILVLATDAAVTEV